MIIIASCPTFQQKAVSQSANDIDDSRKRRKVIDTESETDEPAARPACTDSRLLRQNLNSLYDRVLYALHPGPYPFDFTSYA